MLFSDIDFSFIKNIFGFNDEEKEKKEKQEKQEKENKRKLKDNKQTTEKNKEKYKTDSDKNINNRKNIPKENIEEKIEKQINSDKIEDKKEEDKNENNNITNLQEDSKKKKKENNKKLKGSKKKEGKKTKEELMNFLVSYMKKIYLFKKCVKKLIQKRKDNYSIVSSINNVELNMEIYLSEDKSQKVKYTYEPILNERIFYIPKKILKKKNLLKFSFLNKKKESIIDPKFNTEYDCGEFINVINLKKIKDKEEEREEEFQTFLESYYTLKQSLSKGNTDIKKYKLEAIRTKKKHRTMEGHKGGLVFGVGGKIASNSILKQRGEKRRVTSNKKISFSDKNETISYKKEE